MKLTRLRRLVRDRRGNALIIAGAGLPMLIAAAGLGVDTFSLSLLQRQLQRAADSGALAAGYAMAQGMSLSGAVDNDVDINSVEDRLTGSPVVESAPTAGSYAGDARAVRVRLTANGYAPFIHFFLRRDMVLNTEATSKMENDGDYCIVALYSGTETGIDVTGNSTLSLGCGMKTNSRSAQALTVTGSANISASPLAAVGIVPPSGNIPTGTIIQNRQTPQVDPFASVPNQNPCDGSEHNYNDNPHDTGSITPDDGTAMDGKAYECIKDLTVKGTLNLNPGTYFITGDVQVNSGATLTGTGVTLVLTGPGGEAGDLDFNGGATINLTAPDDGTYKGIAVYRDRRSTPGGTEVALNGGAGFTIKGAMYLPTTNLKVNGNFGMEAQCIQIVGYKIDVKGGGSIYNNCPAGGGPQMIKGTVVRLVA